MIVNVIDVEATCWQGKPPVASEIIEIGIAEINLDTHELINANGMFVKPILSTSLSPFCTELTGLTDEEIFENSAAYDFSKSAQVLIEEYNSVKRPWLSWGQYDFNQFQRDAQLHGIKNPMGRNHLNLKLLYSLKTGKKQVGMDKALKELGMELIGQHHSGQDDAHNIARIALEIL